MKERIGIKKGFITLCKEYENGQKEYIKYENASLKKGKEAVARSLLKDEPKVNISSVVFGDGGTINGKPKEVTSDLTSLFGVTRINKPVIAQIDESNSNTIVIFIELDKHEGNDYVLNEMAIKLDNGDLLSMATFKDQVKDSTMKLSWTWLLFF